MVLDVIIPLALPFDHLSYTYHAKASIGARVIVPLGLERVVVGVVRGVRAKTDSPDDRRLKPIVDLLDIVPLFNEQQLRLIEFLAQYYMCYPGIVLRSLIPSAMFLPNDNPSCVLRRKKPTKKRAKEKEIAQELAIEYEKIPEAETLALTKSVTLLRTASTEDIARAIAPFIGKKSVLILAPTQTKASAVAAIVGRYTDVTLFHPGITIKKRAAIFVDLATAPLARVVVGTRSAIGLALGEIGLVVVVDEHSHAYKSLRTPRFSARDAALMLASLHGAKTLLTSEVPSVESYFNATTIDQWQMINRIESPEQPLRHITLEHGKDLISKYLQRRMGEELALGRQVVIFQNRRGWASSMVCSACGYTPTCPACNCSLTLHKSFGAFECHYCGHRQSAVELCPECGARELQPRGRGTERLEEQITEMFPTARVERLDSDAAARYNEIVEQFSLKEADIVVGTQMIIESLDFTNVGIVAVANADNMLSAGDFRASELSYRLLNQLANRAQAAGAELIVQSSSHNNPTIESAMSADGDEFYRRELPQRMASHYPPYSRLVRFELRSADRTDLFVASQHVERALRAKFSDSLSPMFQPSVERQSGEHIVHLLLKLERRLSLAAAKKQIKDALNSVSAQHKKQVTIDIIVDPL